MKRYEAMFLVESGRAAAQWDECLKDIKEILDRQKCEIIRLVKWDDRKLAYEIAHQKRGTYVLVFFKAPSEAVARIERDVQLSETILRVLVLRRDKVTEEDMLTYTVPSGEANVIGEARQPVAPVAAAAATAKSESSDERRDSDEESSDE